MRVVFFDKLRETYHAVENIIQLDSVMLKYNGRQTNFWWLDKADGTNETFKQKDYIIHRITN